MTEPPDAPPHDIEIEQALIGCMLIRCDADALAECEGVVTEAHFYRAVHQTIWRSICRIIKAGGRITSR